MPLHPAVRAPRRHNRWLLLGAFLTLPLPVTARAQAPLGADAPPNAFQLRLGAGGTLNQARQTILSAGASVPLGSHLRVLPDAAFGAGSDFTTLTGSVALVLSPLPSAAWSPYVGGGGAWYRESSDLSGVVYTRSTPGWMVLAGVQGTVGRARLFGEGRYVRGRYEGDESVTAMEFSLPRVLAGVSFAPFHR